MHAKQPSLENEDKIEISGQSNAHHQLQFTQTHQYVLHEPFSASAKYSFSLLMVASNCCRSICHKLRISRQLVTLLQLLHANHLEHLRVLPIRTGIVFGIWRMCHRCNRAEQILSYNSAAVLVWSVVTCWWFRSFLQSLHTQSIVFSTEANTISI